MLVSLMSAMRQVHLASDPDDFKSSVTLRFAHVVYTTKCLNPKPLVFNTTPLNFNRRCLLPSGRDCRACLQEGRKLWLALDRPQCLRGQASHACAREDIIEMHTSLLQDEIALTRGGGGAWRQFCAA